jgi:hypothetical protein
MRAQRYPENLTTDSQKGPLMSNDNVTHWNLLVVDWDFFFPNPMLSSDPGPDVMLYDWTHSESDFYQRADTAIWTSRAGAFFQNNLDLPTVQGWETFWDRFTWRHHDDNDIPMQYTDSNLYAGLFTPYSLGWSEDPESAWSTVSLWDAHHDCGYKAGDFEAWREARMVTCEDWMLAHYARGSRLEVTYPGWRGAVGEIEPEPWVPVQRRVDDGTDPDMPFDAVFVCRSGAWVPSWCDDQFTQFLKSGPNTEPDRVIGVPFAHPRPDVLLDARQMAEMWQLVMNKIPSGKVTHEA